MNNFFKKVALCIAPLSLLVGCSAPQTQANYSDDTVISQVNISEADTVISRALQAETNINKPVIRAGKSVSGNFANATAQFTATNQNTTDSNCGRFNVVVTYHRGSGRTEYIRSLDREICLTVAEPG